MLPKTVECNVKNTFWSMWPMYEQSRWNVLSGDLVWLKMKTSLAHTLGVCSSPSPILKAASQTQEMLYFLKYFDSFTFKPVSPQLHVLLSLYCWVNSLERAFFTNSDSK